MPYTSSAHRLSSSASSGLIALPSSSSSGDQVYSSPSRVAYTPLARTLAAPWSPAPDPELDDEELNVEIHGLHYDDDLEVEVDSDDFEVVGVVYASTDDEFGSDAGERPQQDEGVLDSPSHPDHELDRGVVSTTKAEVSKVEMDLDVQSEVETLDQTCGSTRCTNKEVIVLPDIKVEVTVPQRRLRPRALKAQATVPFAPGPAGKRRRTNTISDVASREEDEASHAGDDSDDEEGSRRRTKKARGKRGEFTVEKRSRMRKKQAHSYQTKSKVDAVCGIEGCEATVFRNGGWKTHLDDAHYALPPSATDKNPGLATKPMAVASPSSSRGCNHAAAEKDTALKRKRKQIRKLEAKENSECKKILCRHDDCTEKKEYSTLDILYRHIRTQHWQWTTDCPVCKRSFGRVSTMTRHFKAQHPSDQLPIADSECSD
ncbi:hypothetical protein BN946_scf185016.g79 [Trametes cinnabarina]|uniref:C2H2-type domain-containing protein n=1 Tax=Pycnoporus cinnabarinus TaxID=5643 RepID=A0A060SHD8_PYCCI|nr:hypothetical protein BN946_scf185016.g79 [Trametes cinnabarina]